MAHGSLLIHLEGLLDLPTLSIDISHFVQGGRFSLLISDALIICSTPVDTFGGLARPPHAVDRYKPFRAGWQSFPCSSPMRSNNGSWKPVDTFEGLARPPQAVDRYKPFRAGWQIFPSHLRCALLMAHGSLLIHLEGLLDLPTL